MIKSIAREYHWAPTTIGALFIDDLDIEGLIFWYNDISEMANKLKTPPTPTL